MSRRTTGTVLLLIAAMLYSTRFLAAAIFGSSIQSWDAGLFNAMLQYVGRGLTNGSMIALGAGLVYLAWAEAEVFLAFRKSKQDHS